MNNLWFIMKRIANQHGQFLPTLFLIGIFGGVLPTINVIAPKLIIDELTAGKSLKLIALYVGLIIIGNFLSAYVVERLQKKLEVFITASQGRLKMELIEHSNRLPIHVSESKSNQDALDLAIFGMNYFGALVNVLPVVIKAVFSIFTTALILSKFNVGIPIFLLFTSLLIIPLLRKQKNLEEDNAQRSKPEDRQYIFFVNFSLDFRYAKDLKIFKGSKLILDKAKENMDNILRINHEYFTQDGHLEGVKGVITEIQTVVIFIYLVFKFINDKLSFGNFIMTFNAVRQMGQSLKQVWEQFNTIILIDTMFKPYLSYINLPLEEELGETGYPLELGEGFSLRFEDVSFHYPASEQMILEHCSFEIKSGQRVALVGRNGAGKSTIIKLICRFYQPSSGKIYVNGIDIEEIPKQEYYKMLSVIFQDFRLFPFKISENIACKHIDDYEPQDRAKICQALDQVNLSSWIASLQEKEDSYYSDILSQNGVLPSGGQGQKIALARSIYHGGCFTIMDEPTAALDPRSEEEIFNQMLGLTKARTSLFISHRLSSTRFADYILVCDQGKITEKGTHSELMDARGLYARMYATQAEQYSYF